MTTIEHFTIDRGDVTATPTEQPLVTRAHLIYLLLCTLVGAVAVGMLYATRVGVL